MKYELTLDEAVLEPVRVAATLRQTGTGIDLLVDGARVLTLRPGGVISRSTEIYERHPDLFKYNCDRYVRSVDEDNK